MTNPITSCHKVEAKIYSADEGTSHYYCPVCDQSVNVDGSNPEMTEQSDSNGTIMSDNQEPMLTNNRNIAKDRLYQDLMEIIGEDADSSYLDQYAPEKDCIEAENNIRDELRQALHSYIYGEEK